jgi:soluble lytic murein transglycosylase-like protein
MKIMIVAVIMILGGAFYAIDNATQKIASANVESLDKQQEELDQLNKDAIKLQKEVEEARIKKEQLIREMYPIKVAQQQGYSAEVGKAIIRSSKEFGVKTELIMGMIYSESTWRNLPPNECGATGLMQVTYNTARNVAEDLGMDKNNIDLNDPSTNIRLGTYIISNLIRQYGDINTALTAYNMGEGGMKDYVAYYGTSRSGYARTVLYHSSKYEQD